MIFNRPIKPLFLIGVFLFLPHCGLHIGEDAPPVPKYMMPSSAAAYCLDLNYEEELYSYFLKEQEENLPDNFSGQNLNGALECIVSRVESIKNEIGHGHFEREELINFLDQDFVKTKDMEPIINHIVHPTYFDDYILIKDSVIDLIGRQPDNSVVSNGAVCRKKPNGKIAFSKQEVDILMNFLNNFSEFLLMVEKNSYEVFEQFFKNHKADPHLLSRSQLKKSESFRKNFISFLADYLNEDFPTYSLFLKNVLSRQEELQPLKQTASRWRIREHFMRNQKAKEIEDVLQPFLEMAQWPVSPSDHLTVQNIKYILLNVYITKAFFAIYDINKNSVLDPEELETLSCLITPLASVIVSSLLEDEGQIAKQIAKHIFKEPKAVASYIIKYQKMPPKNWPDNFLKDLSFLQYRYFENQDNFWKLSYTDVSRLVSALLLELLNKGKSKMEKAEKDPQTEANQNSVFSGMVKQPAKPSVF